MEALSRQATGGRKRSSVVGFQPPLGTVILMAKEPRPGKAKTRLATSVGEEAAAQVAKLLLDHAVETIAAVPRVAKVIQYSPPSGQAWFRRQYRTQNRRDRAFQPQKGSTLGERMYFAFARAFSFHPPPVVMIGSDIPLLRPEHIGSAFAVLSRKKDPVDVVYGPADDGGYVLIGFRKFRPEVIRELCCDVTMSAETTLAESLDIAEKRGLSVHQLEQLPDVDTLDDLEALMEVEADGNERLAGLQARLAELSLT